MSIMGDLMRLPLHQVRLTSTQPSEVLMRLGSLIREGGQPYPILVTQGPHGWTALGPQSTALALALAWQGEPWGVCLPLSLTPSQLDAVLWLLEWTEASSKARPNVDASGPFERYCCDVQSIIDGLHIGGSQWVRHR